MNMFFFEKQKQKQKEEKTQNSTKKLFSKTEWLRVT